ncbi:MAG: hypothetical protein ACR2I2_07405 [Bryobacteraceae bacterium]
MPPIDAKQQFHALSARLLKGQWKLPPLILHPFAGDPAVEPVMQGSRASLMLHGLVPNKSLDKDELTRVILRGRYQEIKMLYFVGKDLLRWIEQCLDSIGRIEELVHAGIREQSFAALLVESPSDKLTEKLKTWGIVDHRTIFSRAIGLNALMTDVPLAETLTPMFMLNYHRFADHLYICYQHLAPFTPIQSENFDFELYASEEYSRILAEQWNGAEIA